MANRMDKVNKEIMRVAALVVRSEAELPADALVTVTRASATRNLQAATVWLSVLPAAQGEAVLSALQAQMYDLQGSFNRSIALQPLPRLTLALDPAAVYGDAPSIASHPLAR